MGPAAEAITAWEALTEPFRLAFEQAWHSWCEGNLGIGAVLSEPTTGEIVSIGRNRVHGNPSTDEALSGNFMAHAEMNAFAAMDRFRADGLHLFTTLEPCVMCAATGLFLHVGHVHYAAADEYFDELDDLWDAHPYTRRHRPPRTGPLPGPLAALARVLPLSVVAGRDPNDSVMVKARTASPAVAALALELASDGTLEAVRAGRDPDGGGALDVLVALWARTASRVPSDANSRASAATAGL
ncbi:MAG: nucleoside deaminase, partial [Actinomycetota bacterium]